jgi:hypothetical protein
MMDYSGLLEEALCVPAVIMTGSKNGTFAVVTLIEVAFFLFLFSTKSILL